MLENDYLVKHKSHFTKLISAVSVRISRAYVINNRMPLFHKARRIMRINLQTIQDGKRVKFISVGTLTAVQLEKVNAHRAALGVLPVIEELVFKGKHIYDSRIIKDGYTIEDVLDQIESGMSDTSVVIEGQTMTGMENPKLRPDRYGSEVKDRIVFECTSHHPRPELYSVVPKGDNRGNK